ncbi:MAG: SulP family inorganic anion transporter [Frankiales bacterium]|nr:SulP family inorganic anion transporter [Frankiales bacterium]
MRGQRYLRRQLRAARSALPKRENLKADLLAGLPGAISSVPDGMATSVLAGVSPVHGLYASIGGPIGGGLSQSTRLMVVTTTSAAALAAGSAVSDIAPGQREDALFLLTILTGIVMIAAGLLRLGRYTRFVPHSVMIGFLTGISVNILLGQLPDLLGYHAHGSTNLAKAIDTVSHLSVEVLPSAATGAAAIAITIVLARTRVRSVAALFALVLPTAAVIILAAGSVARVRDSGAIPSGVPIPHLPRLSALTFSVVTGAFSVAAIVLVQGAGVAQSAPNPSGHRSSPNQDFIGQGVGNIVSGVIQGQPVGGSVGRTAFNVATGAKSRWASIFSGGWMLIILLLFSEAVGLVAMPTLAGVLMVAAVGSLRVDSVATIWRTSRISQVGLITTFLATLLLPVAAAVGIGVAVGLLLQLNQEALDLRVVSLVPTDDEHFAEHPAPRKLPSHAVTVLDVYGSLYYAGARTLQSRLPDPAGSAAAAVVLRLRGRTMVGATFIVVIDDYLARLAANEGRLFLSGVDPDLADQLGRFDRFDSAGLEILTARPVLGGSTREAYERAARWVSGRTQAGR